MSIDLDYSLLLFSNLLRYRLCHSSTIGATIIDPSKALATKAQDHIGRYVGYFWANDYVTNFMLYVRKDALSTVEAVFLFRPEGEERSVVTPAAKNEPKRFIGENSGHTPKFTYVSIFHQYDTTLDAGAIIETLLKMIGPNLLTHYLERERACIDRLEAVCSIDYTLKPCSGKDEMSRVLSLLSEAKGIRIPILDRTFIPPDLHPGFEIVCLLVDQHYCFLLPGDTEGDVTLYLPHSEHLSSHNYIILQSSLERYYRYQLQRHVDVTITPIRLIAPEPVSCRSTLAAGGLLVLMALSPYKPLCVTTSDVYWIRNGGLELPEQSTSVQASSPISSQQAIEWLEPIPDDVGVSPISSHPDVQCTGPDGSQINHSPTLRNLCEDIENQRRIIMSYSKDDIPMYKAVAIHDPKNELLDREDVFLNSLVLTIDQWKVFIPVILTEVTRMNDWISSSVPIDFSRADYIVVPIIDELSSVLLIVDNIHSHWFYLNGKSDLNVVRKDFTEFALMIKDKFPTLGAKREALITSTNYFHTNFPKLHLLLMAFTIGRLFKYAKLFPRRVIYTEKLFRRFCWYICNETQLCNHDYNVSNGLLGENGDMLAGAYYCYSSSVQFQRSVVPTDVCMYCLTRNHKNMGKHMAAKHGGQAKEANMARQLKESLGDSSEQGSNSG